jgi:hypothetical protein
VKGVRVFDIVGQPVLVSRESARSVKPMLAKRAGDGDGKLCLDFSGARGVAPSFIDEALLVAEECLRESGQPDVTIIFAQPPTILAAKHHTIARAHGRTLVETENGDWEFRKI